MDKQTRGLVENALDEMIESLDVRNFVGWILEEYPIESVEDLALGYVLGFLARYAQLVVCVEKDAKKFWKGLKKSREEFVKEFEEEYGKKPEFLGELEPSAGVKRSLAKLTKKDVADIRNMLRRRILDIRDRISRELGR